MYCAYHDAVNGSMCGDVNGATKGIGKWGALKEEEERDNIW
jgi:hypothetical protein